MALCLQHLVETLTQIPSTLDLNIIQIILAFLLNFR